MPPPSPQVVRTNGIRTCTVHMKDATGVHHVGMGKGPGEHPLTHTWGNTAETLVEPAAANALSDSQLAPIVRMPQQTHNHCYCHCHPPRPPSNY